MSLGLTFKASSMACLAKGTIRFISKAGAKRAIPAIRGAKSCAQADTMTPPILLATTKISSSCIA